MRSTAMMGHQRKITIGEMREMGVRGLLVYCSDYKCGHWGKISADRWPDHSCLSDLEALFVCQACGIKGGDLRPDFEWDRRPIRGSQDLGGAAGPPG